MRDKRIAGYVKVRAQALGACKLVVRVRTLLKW